MAGGLTILLGKASGSEDEGEDEGESYGPEECARELCAILGVDEAKAPELAEKLAEFIEMQIGDTSPE